MSTSETKELTAKDVKKINSFEEEMFVVSGEVAPITGVIVPDYNYREYQKAFDFRYINMRDQKYQDILTEVNCEDECKKQDSTYIYIATSFLAGVVLGLVAR